MTSRRPWAKPPARPGPRHHGNHGGPPRHCRTGNPQPPRRRAGAGGECTSTRVILTEPALVAQWIEHRFPKPGVASSILAGGIAGSRSERAISCLSSRSEAAAAKHLDTSRRGRSAAQTLRETLRGIVGVDQPAAPTTSDGHGAGLNAAPPPLQGGGRRFDPVILHSSRSPRSSTGSGIRAASASRTPGDTRCQEAPRNATIGHVLVTPDALRAPVIFRVTAALVTGRARGSRSRRGAAWVRGPPCRHGPRERASATPAPRNDATRGASPGSCSNERAICASRLLPPWAALPATPVGSVDDVSTT